MDFAMVICSSALKVSSKSPFSLLMFTIRCTGPAIDPTSDVYASRRAESATESRWVSRQFRKITR